MGFFGLIVCFGCFYAFMAKIHVLFLISGISEDEALCFLNILLEYFVWTAAPLWKLPKRLLPEEVAV